MIQFWKSIEYRFNHFSSFCHRHVFKRSCRISPHVQWNLKVWNSVLHWPVLVCIPFNTCIHCQPHLIAQCWVLEKKQLEWARSMCILTCLWLHVCGFACAIPNHGQEAGPSCYAVETLTTMASCTSTKLILFLTTLCVPTTIKSLQWSSIQIIATDAIELEPPRSPKNKREFFAHLFRLRRSLPIVEHDGMRLCFANHIK